MRSTEVAGVFGAFVGRPDGFGSSDFANAVDFFMPHRSIWVSGADFIKIMDLLTEEGSNFEDFGEEKVGRDIDLFALAFIGGLVGWLVGF